MQLFISLANRLDAEIIELANEKKTDKSDAVFWLKKIADKGGLKSITAPVEWQKQLRKDSNLPNR
ncbi:MAG: hypothetical protein L3J74_06035 [Bacteroidales bacterium]|nr:hypothetical protein [Bacteroidales bacterium]